MSESGQHEDGRFDRRLAILVAVTGGVIGILGAVLGSLVQIYGAEQTKNSEIKEARNKEDRERRADAYLTFVAAVERSENALGVLRSCVEAEPGPKLGSGVVVLRDPCVQQAVAYAPLWQAAVDAATKVSIYGSQEAVDQSRKLFETLPRGRVTDEGRLKGNYVPLEGYKEAFKFDFPSYDSEHNSFVVLACRELVNSPRAVCR